MPPSDSVLLLATSEAPFESLPPALQSLFPKAYHWYTLQPPTVNAKQQFWEEFAVLVNHVPAVASSAPSVQLPELPVVDMSIPKPAMSPHEAARTARETAQVVQR